MTNNERAGIVGLLAMVAGGSFVAGSALPLHVANGITIPEPIAVCAIWCLAVAGLAVIAMSAVKLAFWAFDEMRPFSRFLQAVMEVALKRLREMQAAWMEPRN